VEILRARGFGETWIGWIKKIVIGVSVSVSANGEESNTFKTGKGLRQGDPLSLLLFRGYMMLGRAADKGLMRKIK
jgi:hypothetical protein